MTPSLWEVVLELQKHAKLKDNVIFTAQGAPKQILGTYFFVKLKNKLGPLSYFFRFWPKKCIFGPFTVIFGPPVILGVK